MVFVGYVVNVARGFFLLACLYLILFCSFLYCFSSFSANHQLAPFWGAFLVFCVVSLVCGFSSCVRVDYYLSCVIMSRFAFSIRASAASSVATSPCVLRRWLPSGCHSATRCPLARSSASSWSSSRAWFSWFMASSSVGLPPFSFFRSRFSIGYPSVFVQMRILRVVSPPSLSSCSASIVAIRSLPPSPVRVLLHFFVVVLRFGVTVVFMLLLGYG